jgi:pyruvate dehydrogenase E1 component alpha subunit
MPSDLWSLYEMMLKCRLFEEAIANLWHDGLISGEMHLGTGEEAIIAGVLSHLQKGDALALDHRATAAMLLHGVDPVLILRELLGYSNGLCGGKGGHMHLFSKEHLAASSGIVGSSGPAAAGFALAARYLRPEKIAVSFFGEGAINQGMLMESMNLASIWKLPVLFVCKDDSWSITAESQEMTGGTLINRAEGLGLEAFLVDGLDVGKVRELSGKVIAKIRSGGGPVFIQATCVHLEGHFLGYQLLRIIRQPLTEMPKISGPITRSMLRFQGGQIKERIEGLKTVLSTVIKTLRDPRGEKNNDPLTQTRKLLLKESDRLKDIEEKNKREIGDIITDALREVSA